MTMYGTYRIYKDNELVAEQKNKLTVLGRSLALKAMLGQSQYFANSFGIGVSSQSNGTDTFLNMNDLGFTVGKYPISSSTLGYGSGSSTDGLVYTTRITDTSRYYITEIGLFSNVVTDALDVDDLTIFNFETGDPLKETVGTTNYYIGDTYTGGAASFISDNTNYRIGSNALKITGTSKTVFFDELVMDLSNINNSDSFVLAAHNYNPSAGSRSVTITFSSGENSTLATSDYTFTLVSGYNVLSKRKDSATTITGTMDWSAINKISIKTSSGFASTDYVLLDGLRIKYNKPTDAVDGLVSRAVLTDTQIIQKDAGSIIDIQYILSMELETT